MTDEELHYPPGAEPEKPAEPEPDAPTEEKPEETPAPEPETPEEKKEEETPSDEQPDDSDTIKKRSIYDAKKEEKARRKEAEATAETEKARADAAEAKAAELQALLAKKDEAVTPTEKSEAASDLKAYAEKHDLAVDQLDELAQIILSKVPKADTPEGLSKEEIEQWRADRAKTKVEAEDRAIDAQSGAVKTAAKSLGFEIHDDAELANIMAEIKRLAHTPEYHDKPVDYIVFAKRAEFSKLVSPKKPSFESGGQQGEANAEDIDLSSGRVTPALAQKAVEDRGRSPGYDIRRAE